MARDTRVASSSSRNYIAGPSSAVIRRVLIPPPSFHSRCETSLEIAGRGKEIEKKKRRKEKEENKKGGKNSTGTSVPRAIK